MPNRDPKFTVMIPTREREGTLPAAIASALVDPRDDLEVLVVDNFGEGGVRTIVEAIADRRVRYVRAPRRLPMSENWSFGLGHVRGRYVFILGDDDAMMPDGLARVDRCLRETGQPIVAWRKETSYYWKDAILTARRNMLHVDLARVGEEAVVASKDLLAVYYASEVSFADLPSLYTSFVERSILERIKDRAGQYFVTSTPDVESGVSCCYFVDSFARLARGASLSGTSGSSIGTSAVFPNLSSAARDKWALEHDPAAYAVHESLVPSTSLEMHIANVNIRARLALFPDDDRYDVRIDRVIGSILGNINRNPDRYEELLDDAQRLAAKYRLALKPEAVPPKKPRDEVRRKGLSPSGLLAIDGDVAGFHDAAAAARVASALLPD